MPPAWKSFTFGFALWRAEGDGLRRVIHVIWSAKQIFFGEQFFKGCHDVEVRYPFVGILFKLSFQCLPPCP